MNDILARLNQVPTNMSPIEGFAVEVIPWSLRGPLEFDPYAAQFRYVVQTRGFLGLQRWYQVQSVVDLELNAKRSIGDVLDHAKFSLETSRASLEHLVWSDRHDLIPRIRAAFTDLRRAWQSSWSRGRRPLRYGEVYTMNGIVRAAGEQRA